VDFSPPFKKENELERGLENKNVFKFEMKKSFNSLQNSAPLPKKGTGRKILIFSLFKNLKKITKFTTKKLFIIFFIN